MGKMDRSKPRLGRGLSSLMAVSDPEVTSSVLPIMRSIPTDALPSPSPSPSDATLESAPEPLPTAAHPLPASADVIQLIDLDSIVPNPHQPRKQFDNASLAELAASLKSTGLIQPVLVRKAGSQYQLIAGERRWRAARIAGLPAIPAIVRQADSATQAQMALVENIQREDLNPIDRAQSYRSLMDQLGLTQAELAVRLGEDRSGIANHLRLLGLIEPVRELVRSTRISFGHAKLLAGVEDMLEQQRIANLVVTDGLSVRQLEQLLQQPAANPISTQATGPSPHIRDLEQSLSRQIGMRVQVRSRGKKGAGQLMIHFSSLDQFDVLLARLGAQAEPS